MPRIGHALTASAKKVSFSTRIPGKLKEEPWQDRAWDAYDRVPAVAKAIEWRRNVARKIDYFVARRESPTEDPEPVETGPAVDVLAQVGGPNLIRTVVADLVTHWGIVGEAHLASIEDT